MITVVNAKLESSISLATNTISAAHSVCAGLMTMPASIFAVSVFSNLLNFGPAR